MPLCTPGTANINGHKHIHIFPVIRAALLELLARQASIPYLRRIREPGRNLAAHSRARIKRFGLSTLGAGRPGNNVPAGCLPMIG